MKFVVYDSATRKKQPLLAEGQDSLGLYFCGPTVYQRIHIGNARTFVTFMALTRYLRFCGITVQCVSNITDVNDKIYAAAAEQGIASSDLAKQATQWYVQDTDGLGLGRPDAEPKATEHIAGIITLISELIERDLAYVSGGDVYFRVDKYSDYGKLSNRQIEEMIEGSRGDLETGNKDKPLDFVLWKASKSAEDTSWESPWGSGRPGWHIECSAMAQEVLGDSFDVHGGGLDLIFPHHENEVAQSRGAGHGFARLWMHGGMLEFGGGKMSKSEGNIATLADVLSAWPSWAVVLFFFSASYRNPLEFSDDALEQARQTGQRITESLRRSERYLGSVETRNAGDPEFADSSRYWEGMHEALRDDFNLPNALSELHGLIYDLNTAVNEHATPQIIRDLRLCLMEFLEVFGLLDLVPQSVDLSEEVKDLLASREKARSSKDFAEADRIRDVLLDMGYVVRDTADGSDVVSADEVDEADEAGSEGDPVEALDGGDVSE